MKNKSMISKITLGTAQLGMVYGIANKVRRLEPSNSAKILKVAFENGINCFDTSPSYGDSEKILGCFVENNKKGNFTIINKIPTIQIFKESISFEEVYREVKTTIDESIKRLKIEKIPIILLHDPTDMHNHEGFVTKSLIQLKKEGIVDKIGVSIYSPHEVKEFLEINVFDAIQIPINIFDNRLIKSGLLDDLIKTRKLIFVRSIFLQGIFFLDPYNLPPNLQIAKKPLIELNKISLDSGISINELALKFVRDLKGITSLVIGIDNLEQLKINIKLINSPSLPNEVSELIYKKFDGLPEELINPSKWNKKDVDTFKFI